jgi:hypothetical protein
VTRTPPDYIKAAEVISAPIEYEWDSDLGLEFYAAKDQNIRLYRAIDASNFKAKTALATAVTEWIVWRLEGHADVRDAHRRIEAAWASVVHPLYAKDLFVKLTKNDDTAPVEAPLELALCLLGKIEGRYADGNIYLAAPIVNLSMLAQHLMPNEKDFSNWLSATLRRMAKVFPRGGEYDRESGKYDASGEKPVPREFFDPSFDYSEAAATAAWRVFLESLDPKDNPYLRSREEMTAGGFQGKPYTI